MSIAILIQSCDSEQILTRQLPFSSKKYRNCIFYFNANEMPSYDYLIVYESLYEPLKIRCPQSNTIFITGEPESIRLYNHAFLSQFSQIITSQRSIQHKNVRYYQQALPWQVGIDRGQGNKFNNFNWDFFVQNVFSKTKCISVISSDKNYSEGHRKRVQFVSLLKETFGDSVSVYGRGIQTVNDKLEALKDYKYHIVIENDSIEDYWTEKLADCFLADTYPIYYGCPNLTDYFPADSFSYIDINEPAKAIDIIFEIIKNDMYEKNREALLQSKKLILEKYNLFSLISEVCTDSSSTKKNNTYLPESFFPRLNHIMRKIKRIIKQNGVFKCLFLR